MNWKWFFQKGMFLVLLFAYFIDSYFNGEEVYGINKTVGWSIYLSNQWFYNGLMIFSSWLIYLIGYAVLALFKKKTDLYLSITHLALFILTLIAGVKANLYGFVTLIIGMISLIIFSLNFYKTVISKKEIKHTPNTSTT